jgi:tetratricopeptide (TPR) repeat protein
VNLKVKVALYAVLLLMAAGFGWGFYANYTTSAREAAAPAAGETPAGPSNNPAAASNSAVPAPSTNATAQNGLDASNTIPAPPVAETAPAPAPVEHRNQGAMIAYLAALVGTLIGLGLMIAHDFTQIVGNITVDALLDPGEAGERDPDYERAEDAWAKGKLMEAIELLREFLKARPRAQYAAIRIAEIYEKDLNNPVAAALEYEELLKQKLPPERWGWAAVHLCNLYNKLGQQDKAKVLLQRIADEYPRTAAAKKARTHLGLPEPEPEPIPKHESTATAAPGPTGNPPAKEQPAPAPPPPPPPPKPSLPPGFRPKG